MRKKGGYSKYDYLGIETIRKASEGDGEALSAVISRYQNYGRKCLRVAAGTKYKLDMGTLPVDDLMQIVLMRLAKVIVKKYRISE